jgi:hypothetical protein
MDGKTQRADKDKAVGEKRRGEGNSQEGLAGVNGKTQKKRN